MDTTLIVLQGAVVIIASIHYSSIPVSYAAAYATKVRPERPMAVSATGLEADGRIRCGSEGRGIARGPVPRP